MLRKALKENPIFLYFSSFQMVHQLSLGIVVPFWSLILLEANWSISQITIFFAISSFVIFMLGGSVGKIADTFGKKNIIFLGLFIQAFFFTSYYFFLENVFLMMIARVFEILSFLCISMVGIGALGDFIKSKRGFWTGVFLGLGTIGMMIGPIVAGYIAQYSLHKTLLLFSVVLTIVCIFILTKIPNNSTKRKHKFTISDFNPFSEISHFLKYRKLQGMALLGILMNSKGQVYAIFFPIFVIESLGLPTHYLGYLYSIPIFCHIFQVYFGKISDSISAEFGVLLGVFLSCSALFLFPYVNSTSMLVAMLIVFGIGSGIWNVNAWTLMGGIGKEKNIEAEITGTYMSIAKLGVFFTTLVSASLIGYFGIERTLQLFSIIIFVGIAFTYFFFEPIFHKAEKESHFSKIHKHLNR